jgi:hypothetical protein
MVSTIWGNCFQLKFNGNPREISLNLYEKQALAGKPVIGFSGVFIVI